jgi:hypothetical protein
MMKNSTTVVESLNLQVELWCINFIVREPLGLLGIAKRQGFLTVSAANPSQKAGVLSYT